MSNIEEKYAALLNAAIFLVKNVKSRKGTEHELKVSPIEIYRLKEAIEMDDGNK